MSGKVGDSITITRQTGCGPCHVTLVFRDSEVSRVSVKLGRNGTCACAMVSSLGKLASLAIKHGATLADVSKKMAGVTCHQPVPSLLGVEAGCSSCADAIGQVLQEQFDAMAKILKGHAEK